MSKAIIYVRVSTKEQLEGSSLEVQERMCREFALRNGYDEDVKVFVEKGESAKTADRTELKTLLEFVAKNHKEISAAIVHKIDRLARNSLDFAQLKLFFNRYGVKFLSATENLEDTPVGRLMETQLAGFAQFDNEIRTERSVGGMVAAVKAGRYVWGAPVGYINTGGRGRTNLAQNPDNPEIVKLVRKAWVLVDTGCNLEEARKQISKEGLHISKSNFPRMFRNKVYMGIIEKFGLSVVGDFKPIVEPELFQRVLGKLENTGKKIPIYRKDNEEFPIRGLVICSECGKGLTASWSRGNGGRYAFYRCMYCPRKNYHRDDRNTRDGFKEGIETKFIKLLKTYNYKQTLKDALIKEIEVNLEYRNETNKKKVNVLNKQLIQLKAKEKQIAEKNFNNVINDRVAKEMLEENEQKISELTLQLHEQDDTKDEIMKVVRHSITVLEDIGSAWMRVELDIKKRFQKFLFPEGLLYDGDKFGTTRLAYCIEPISTSALQKSHDVRVPYQKCNP